ncbi:hypothetical protein K439DRAFT_410368 [Ramaria rubella]|nr:hypothetical protein K439DRAFT_410368 [Ramaria rubella]
MFWPSPVPLPSALHITGCTSIIFPPVSQETTIIQHRPDSTRVLCAKDSLRPMCGSPFNRHFQSPQLALLKRRGGMRIENI